MLIAYIDESFEKDDGYAVLAGFVGPKRSWDLLACEWKAVLASKKKPALHMKELRKWNGTRHEPLLRELGSVPHDCGLQPVFAAVRIRDYRHLLEHPDGPLSNGYFVTLICLTWAILKYLPKGERVRLIFEQQDEFAAAREGALCILSNRDDFKAKGQCKLASWESVPKSSLLEPADYLAYAIMQRLSDPNSRRSTLCLPILSKGRKRVGGVLGQSEVKKILNFRKPLPM